MTRAKRKVIRQWMLRRDPEMVRLITKPSRVGTNKGSGEWLKFVRILPVARW